MTDLPLGWANTSLGEICERISDGSHNPPKKQSTGLPMLSAININDNSIKFDSYRLISEAEFEIEDRRTQVQADDVLLTIVGAIGRAAVVPKSAQKFTLQRSVAVLRSAAILPRLLMYHLEEPTIAKFFKENARGTAQKGIYLKTLASTPILLPPLNEQRRIVEKIEAMFDEIDKGVESLQTARTTLSLYRQSLLKSAFEGRLTADWRAQNADKLEAPETLLARIQAERDTRYKTALDAWQDALAKWRADGEKGKKPAKPKRLPALAATAAPFPIPENWIALSVGSLGRVETGATPPTKSKDNFGGNVPFFKPTDLEAGVDVREAREFLSETGVEKSRPFSAGTILVTCIGATIGKTGLAGVDGACNQQINYIEPDPNFAPRFIYYQIISSFFQAQIKDNASSTTLPILNKGKFSQLPTIICSPAEQAEIVRILDEKLEAADALEAEIDAALTRADALRQSILKKAFSGQLVAQDPNDEPASALLERIKAERAMVPRAKKRKTAHA